jgi:hypothetical protein
MIRRLLPVGLFLAAGCLTEKASTPLVPPNPFGTSPVVQTPSQVSYSPASEEAAKRVGLVGQKILMANPQLGIHPLFRTIGAPQAEIFHRGTTELCITEGLVKQCATEGQLAAVLSVEMGKMIAEREALAGPAARTPERAPPIEVRVGNDSGGSYGSPDLTQLAERGMFEKERRREAAAAIPDPQALARNYLMKAGYNAGDLDTVAPVLRATSANNQLEKQFNGLPTPARSWTR